MHYKNGREAKNGDKIILVSEHGVPVVGVLYDATPGNDLCNGYIAPRTLHHVVANLSECLHVEDFKAAMPAEVPDTSVEADLATDPA